MDSVFGFAFTFSAAALLTVGAIAACHLHFRLVVGICGAMLAFAGLTWLPSGTEATVGNAVTIARTKASNAIRSVRSWIAAHRNGPNPPAATA